MHITTMTCLEVAMETLNAGNPVLKNVFKSSNGDDLEQSLQFLLSSPSAYYINVPELRSTYRFNLGFYRPFRRSVAWHRHNSHTTNCLKQCFTHFIRSNNFQGFLEQKCPSGINISFTSRWRKLAEGPFTKTLFTLRGPDQSRQTPLPGDAVAGHFAVHAAFPLLHLNITIVTPACAGKQTGGSTTCRLLCRRRLPRRRRLTLTCVGSKVRVHGWCSSGLNGALCVTTGTSSNPRLQKVTAGKKKKVQSSAWSKHLGLRPLLSLPSLISLLFLNLSLLLPTPQVTACMLPSLHIIKLAQIRSGS